MRRLGKKVTLLLVIALVWTVRCAVMDFYDEPSSSDEITTTDSVTIDTESFQSEILNTETTTDTSIDISDDQYIVTTEMQEVIIERVVDGDTIIVIADDGTSFRVRLIGIDTPESVNPDESKNCEEGIVASDYTKSRLKTGDIVFLEYDVSSTDKYDRTLAYVWLYDKVDTTSLEDIEKYMYNAELIIQGYAVPKVYKPNVKYADIFQSIYDNL